MNILCRRRGKISDVGPNSACLMILKDLRDEIARLLLARCNVMLKTTLASKDDKCNLNSKKMRQICGPTDADVCTMEVIRNSRKSLVQVD